jgi:hypothetical protein
MIEFDAEVIARLELFEGAMLPCCLCHGESDLVAALTFGPGQKAAFFICYNCLGDVGGSERGLAEMLTEMLMRSFLKDCDPASGYKN